jgi:MoaA/NifB/PqqE/SkfB family radical SAM enzyme
VKRVFAAGRLLRTLVGTRLGHARPLVALWELTYRCNMGCDFCNEKNLPTPELDTPSALELIRQLAALRTSVILLTGGEPTLRKDFATLMDAIAPSGMTSVLCTNGSNVSRKLDAVLKADLIRISVDGFGEVHDRIRDAPGAFERIREAVPLLVRAGKPPMLVTVVTPQASRENLCQLLEQARSWGVQVDLSMVVFSKRTEPSSTHVHLPTVNQARNRLPSETFLELLAELEGRYPDVVANPRFYRSLVADGGLGKRCRALDVSLNIKPDGKVSLPCDAFALRELAGDIPAIWAEMQAMRAMKDRLGEYAFCENCYKRCIAFPSLLLEPRNLADLLLSYLPTLARQRPSAPLRRESRHLP